jgi:hypothetical protein
VRYLPYPELGNTPNIIVDGARHPMSRLTLSHWPKSGTPRELKADLSAESAFRYLRRPDLHVDAEVVSNDHFDEDGLISLYAMVEPQRAAKSEELLVDVAAAGDFGTYRFRDAARTAFTLGAFVDPDLSPLDASIFTLDYPEKAAALYQELLPRLAEIMGGLSGFRQYWGPEDEALRAGEEAVRRGDVLIEESRGLDLAVVRLPETMAREGVHRFTQKRRAACHPMAIHNATSCSRVLLVQGRWYELQFRYESWVQLVSRRPPPRVDLGPLADELTSKEKGAAAWEFDGVSKITPSLHLQWAEESSLDPEVVVGAVQRFLAAAPPAWDPYDPS